MNRNKLILFSIVIAIIALFVIVFVGIMIKKNVPVQNTNPIETKKNDNQSKNDVEPVTNLETETRKEGTPAPIISDVKLEPVTSSGQVLSVTEDTVKIKDETGELNLKFASFTKYYEMKPPTPPVLKDKSIVKEGASVLFGYDKGTLTLNSIMVQ